MACFLKRQVGGEKKKMRKQIFALAIFAVLLVAAGGVVSMAQDTSAEAPTVPSDGIDILAGGSICLDVEGYTSLLCVTITQVGPTEWSIVGQDIGGSYPNPLDGSMYYEGGMFYIGIESFPVADSSYYAGARYRGEIDPSTGCGFVAWDNPMWGSSANANWCVVSCASASVATSGEDPNMG